MAAEISSKLRLGLNVFETCIYYVSELSNVIPELTSTVRVPLNFILAAFESS
jgi:hypothetical protein